jgi:hypothetical protein
VPGWERNWLSEIGICAHANARFLQRDRADCWDAARAHPCTTRRSVATLFMLCRSIGVTRRYGKDTVDGGATLLAEGDSDVVLDGEACVSEATACGAGAGAAVFGAGKAAREATDCGSAIGGAGTACRATDLAGLFCGRGTACGAADGAAVLRATETADDAADGAVGFSAAEAPTSDSPAASGVSVLR